MTKRLTISIFNEAETWRLPEKYVERIRHAAGPSVEVVAAESRQQMQEVLEQTVYLVGQPPSDDDALARTSRLEWIQLTGAVGDFERSLFPALHSGVRVCSGASIRAPQVAEHAMALTLAMLRRLDMAVQAQHDQHWIGEKIAASVRTLWGATVGVVSMGPIGREIAARARAFGAHVIATERPGVSALEVADEVLPPMQTGELLARSDVVIVSAPRTPSTEGMIGKNQLAQIKPGAILIDVSRGGVVQSPALLDALRRGTLSGAGLDVFEPEPLPPNSPLWSLPNVLITPHVSSASPIYWRRATEIICENLANLASGAPLIDEVPLEWYQKPTMTEA